MEIAKEVDSIMRFCLFKEEEIIDGKAPADAVFVDGISAKLGFHPGRLAEKREEIRGLLNEMSPDFHVKGGGGMTFLNLCNDKNGDQWTDFHKSMESLIVLGMAVGMARYCLPREMWVALPGSMPYVMFDTEV
jgi:hypothetical protein